MKRGAGEFRISCSRDLRNSCETLSPNVGEDIWNYIWIHEAEVCLQDWGEGGHTGPPVWRSEEVDGWEKEQAYVLVEAQFGESLLQAGVRRALRAREG